MPRNLPDWIDAFMLLTDNSEPPMLFRKWSAISSIAAALQRKVRVELGLSLTIYPNFYIVLVGPSATGKGTAMKFASDILTKVPSIHLSAQATSLQALIRQMKNVNLTDVELSTGKQVYHSSMTIFSNEFTVFLGYKNNELISHLCDWYDCHERWAYDTIKRDREEIVGVWVNLLAGTTPENIQTSLPYEAIGAGLTSRIIFVNEEKRDKLVIFPGMSGRQVELQQMLIHDLEKINMLSGCFNFTEAALSYYSDWCIYADQNPPFYDPKFDGYCGRRRNHLNSLAMVCSASRSDSMVIELRDMEKASELLSEVEVKMGTTFRGMGKSDISCHIADAVTFINNSLTDDIPMPLFARHFEGNVDKFMLDRVLSTLVVMDYIELVRRPGCVTMIIRKNV